MPSAIALLSPGASDAMNGAADNNSTSPASENAAGSTTSATKRKSSEGAAPQTRSKRNRYISIACNECKRRKIKCNGETPCQRCGNLGLECLYAPNCCTNFKETDDFKHMNAHIATLQQQVDSLFSNLSSLRNQVDTMPMQMQSSSSVYGQASPASAAAMSTTLPLPPRSKSAPKHPRFHGPTSAAFNIGVAKSSLQNMGITTLGADDGADGEGAVTTEATPMGSPKASGPGAYQKPDRAHAQKDPIWLLTKEEAIRLVNVWQDEMGLMYPMLDIDRLLQHVGMLYTFVEAANRSGLMQISLPGADAIHDDVTNLLKLVLATAMVLEEAGRSELGRRIFDYVKPTVDAQLLAPPNRIAVQMLILTAMYYFHKDEEQIAWRMVGLASRVCMEVGLHRREAYKQFANDEERNDALRLFWSLYVLDRRWSLGTGMPFAMQDADIDPTLPKPDDSYPYLNAMIAYSAIGSKLWRSADPGTAKISDEEIGYLDYQVLQWLQAIPPVLQYQGVVDLPQNPDGGPLDSKARANHRLRILLYLRSNQMRVLIYRPVLHTAGNIMENLSNAHTVVDIAKDSIRILHAMNARTDLYRTQQVMFNYFLISALAVLFLAVCHAPAHFAERCRDEFYMALELVRGFSADSYVAKRLWRTIKVLKEVGPKLGLNLRQPNGGQQGGEDADSAQDAHSNAAVAMAGLAGHQVDELAFLANGNGHTRGSSLPMTDSPNGMANDLTSLFEAAGGYSNVLAPSNGNGFVMQAGPGVTPAADMAPGGEQVLPSIFGNEDELSRILRDLF